MKILALQPAYPDNPKNRQDRKKTFNQLISLIDSVNAADLILLPEYSNCMGADTYTDMINDVNENTEILIDNLNKTAKRLNCIIAVNIVDNAGSLPINRTILFDCNGNEIFRYDKQHLTYAEKEILMLDHSYKDRDTINNTVVVNGIKIALLTCYDTYFLQYIESTCMQKPDIILIPSYQRSENPHIITSQATMIASRCNAYLLRSSYAMKGNTGGHTLLCFPDGKIISDMHQTAGLLSKDIDPLFKHYRSNGHGRAEILSDEFVTKGKTLRAYGASGSFLSLSDSEKPYPRICAHRGFSALCPENSVLSIASAIALGADEVEFDLWPTADYEIIATHDSTFKSNPDKKVWMYTYEEILKLDASHNKSELLFGLQYDTFEEILKKFNKQTIMNIHIKTKYTSQGRFFPYDEKAFKKISGLIDKYDCADYVYIAGDDAVLETAMKIAPHLKRCCLAGQNDYTLVDNAIKYRCSKLQFFKPFFNADMIKKAKDHDIKCNIFWSDDPEESKTFLDMGIDTILTNNQFLVQKELTDSGYLIK